MRDVWIPLVRRYSSSPYSEAVHRISVVGSSGSGKTTVGARLAATLSVRHVELDAIHHQAGWEPLPLPAFRERVHELTSGRGWVVDGNYSMVNDITWERADTIVWLDLPRRIVMRRLVWRTLTRGLLRTRLWNGNRERLANFMSFDPEKSVIVWAWTRWDEYRDRYTSLETSFHGRFVRLRSDAEVEAFLSRVGTSGMR